MNNLIKDLLCSDKSILGDIAFFLLGKAKECACCSFWRGFVWGGIVVAGSGAVVVML